MKKIVIAGGCFWGVEAYFLKVKGIKSARVGYVNASKENITYEEVCSQQYQAIEGVELTYDPLQISLTKILELLFRIINPTSLDAQGPDIGYSYRVGAYYTNEEDKQIISEFINKMQPKYHYEIVFENEPLISFIQAEDYHQDYLTKNPLGYCHVNFNVLNKEDLKE